MTNNQYVELLYKKENELIKIVKYHGIYNSFNMEDIIQELYIKLLTFGDINRYVNTDNQPNMYIIFMVLKNIIYDFRKKEKKYSPDVKKIIGSDENNYEVQVQDFPDIPEEVIEYEKYDFIEFDENNYEVQVQYFPDIPEEVIEYEKYDFIVNEIQNITYWFDRQIISLYVNEHHTIRSLSLATKLGFSTIQPIVHRFKLQCQDKYNNKSNID